MKFQFSPFHNIKHTLNFHSSILHLLFAECIVMHYEFLYSHFFSTQFPMWNSSRMEKKNKKNAFVTIILSDFSIGKRECFKIESLIFIQSTGTVAPFLRSENKKNIWNKLRLFLRLAWIFDISGRVPAVNYLANVKSIS